jgi:hypothetical protein
MIRLRIPALVLAALSFAAPLSAQPSAACKPGGTVVAFGNGMRNDLADAQDSLIALSTLHDPSQLDPEGNVEYILAYNSKESIWLEALEVARQKAFDDPTGVWRFLSGEQPPDWFTEPRRLFGSHTGFLELRHRGWPSATKTALGLGHRCSGVQSSRLSCLGPP